MRLPVAPGKNFFILVLLLAGLSVLPSGCKKSDQDAQPEPNPPSVSRDITMITTSAVPGELVVAQANFAPEKDSATITVGNKTVVAVKVDSNRIAFVLPELPANKAATIHYDKMGLTKELSLTVSNYTQITQPDDVYNQFITELDQTQQHYATYEADTIVRLDPQFRQVLEYVKQRFAIQYAGMTSEQKLELAYTLRINMIDDQQAIVNLENPMFYGRTQADPGDPGDVCNNLIAKILGQVGSARIKMLRGGALTAAGAAMIVYGDPVTKGGGVITAGLGVALFINGVDDYIKAHSYDRALNEILGVRAAGFEGLRIASNPIELVKDEERSMVFKGMFRTINQSDASSSNQLIKEGFKEKTQLTELKAVAEKAYDQVKLFLLGNAPAMPAGVPQFSASSVSKVLIMQGAKLSLTNVSNPAITVTFVKEEGGLKIKATSATISQQTTFTMDLVYTNTTTGTTITDKIDAIFKPVSYKLGFLDGTTVPSTAIPFDNNTGKFFILLNQNGSAATGIDYSQISIANNTNANVSVNAFPLSNSTSITLNANQAGSQTISFDVLYKGGKVQTLNGTVSDSLEYYKNLVLGNWTSNAIDIRTGASFEQNKFIINPGGAGIRVSTYYAGTNTTEQYNTPITWSISKSGNAYIMYFGAYDSGRITPSLSFTSPHTDLGWNTVFTKN